MGIFDDANKELELDGNLIRYDVFGGVLLKTKDINETKIREIKEYVSDKINKSIDNIYLTTIKELQGTTSNNVNFISKSNNEYHRADGSFTILG